MRFHPRGQSSCQQLRLATRGNTRRLTHQDLTLVDVDPLSKDRIAQVYRLADQLAVLGDDNITVTQAILDLAHGQVDDLKTLGRDPRIRLVLDLAQNRRPPFLLPPTRKSRVRNPRHLRDFPHAAVDRKQKRSLALLFVAVAGTLMRDRMKWRIHGDSLTLTQASFKKAKHKRRPLCFRENLRSGIRTFYAESFFAPPPLASFWRQVPWGSLPAGFHP